MASQRRMRLLLYLALAAFVGLLFFTNRGRDRQEAGAGATQDFYDKTKDALDNGAGRQPAQQVIPGQHPHAGGDVDEEDEVVAKAMAERLRAAAQRAKDSANAKAPNKPDDPEDIVGVGSSASGQDKKGDGSQGHETDEDHEVETELNLILKKSPVIIFSKSYCPYSKRAKELLLFKYKIEPAPHVVELDIHPLGFKIQDKLQQTTGRRTVPNIMINGISIGGSDDVAALHADKALADKIKSLGAKRVEVTQRSA